MDVIGFVSALNGAADPTHQRAQIERWATAEGHTVVRWAAGPVSGLPRAVTLLETPAVVVHSRRSFGADLLDQELALRDIWRAGGQVLSATPGEACWEDDPGDPGRALVRQLLAAVDEYVRRKRQEAAEVDEAHPLDLPRVS